jgi:hypothetical protein
MWSHYFAIQTPGSDPLVVVAYPGHRETQSCEHHVEVRRLDAFQELLQSTSVS